VPQVKSHEFFVKDDKIITSAGLLAVVHNTYAPASIAAAETTKTTAMSTTAHM
jgi:hypothetical protein